MRDLLGTGYDDRNAWVNPGPFANYLAAIADPDPEPDEDPDPTVKYRDYEEWYDPEV